MRVLNFFRLGNVHVAPVPVVHATRDHACTLDTRTCDWYASLDCNPTHSTSKSGALQYDHRIAIAGLPSRTRSAEL